ncbi:hypothetical protein VP277E431_P0036 [Vibrio phage 277E43-1]|nr:hypothetical protein VP277E431_P0036 [Vibrio phage 277E43-1]
MCDCLTKTEIELIIEDKVHELINQNLEVIINKTQEYSMGMDECGIDVEIWYGDTKVDSDCVTVKG